MGPLGGERYLQDIGPRLTSRRRPVMRPERVITSAIAVALAVLVTAAPAAASSIVFIKGGNVWLANPDGSGQRQVTTGTGWDSPSQADDGTILAQRGTQLFRMNRQGTQLAPAINTSFTGAPPTWVGPVSPMISPDGTHQAYDGMLTDSGVYDPGCGCYAYTHTFTTLWGSATQYAQPNQTLGQEDYVDPAWIDNSHLMLSSTGILIAQVATYTLGGGDNSMTGWFSDPDPSVNGLGPGAITRSGDKLAFVANVNGGVGNEIRIYKTTGPPPSAPVAECADGPNGFQSLRVSFSPDGGSLAYDAPDGIHLITLTGWPSCTGVTDKLIIPGGVEPYFGPANVGPSDGIQPVTPPSNAFTISKRTFAASGKVTLILAAQAPGQFSARASARAGRVIVHAYGTGTAPLAAAGSVRLTIRPSKAGRRAVKHHKRLHVTITITFTPAGGTTATQKTTGTVRSGHHR